MLASTLALLVIAVIVGLLVAAWMAGKRRSIKEGKFRAALPPAERTFFGIAQDSVRLLEDLQRDDRVLTTFTSDKQRRQASRIVKQFYENT